MRTEHLRSGTTYSYILPEMSTLATNAASLSLQMSKTTKQSHVLWYERQIVPPHTCYRLQTLQDRRLDGEPFAAKMLTPAS